MRRTLGSFVLLRLSRTAALIVLADDGLPSSPRLPPDSVLVQTVARARCPVLVARGVRPPSGPLLAAVDGSPSSLLALRAAAAEGLRRRVAVDVAHVVAQGETEEAGRRVLERALDRVPELPAGRTRLLVGDPGPILLRASRRARMMIVGPRGTTGGSLLGTVAQQLLHRCACPTVFVHGTPAEDPPSAGTVPSVGALMS